MPPGTASALLIVAAILFVLAAIPPLAPYGSILARVGLAFLACGHLLG